MKKIALYDIDYTLISVNSLILFLFFLIKKKPIRIIYFPLLGLMTFLWAFRIISTLKIKSFWLLPIIGIDQDELDSLALEFTDKVLKKYIKDGVVENINEYKKNGYLIILATASFEFYMKPLADYLGSDYFFGTKIAFDNGKVTTKVDGRNCKGKEKIDRILKEVPSKDIMKKGSVGYSDSMSDAPFLDLVEVFYKVSRKKWKVLKEIAC